MPCIEPRRNVSGVRNSCAMAMFLKRSLSSSSSKQLSLNTQNKDEKFRCSILALV
jgi:hypothetical protein